MTAMQIIFLIVAAVTLGAALMIATSRRMMHTVLWLVLTLMGVAVLFALLQANFFSVQVLVYIGAIAILILFGVMLTRRSMVDAGESLVHKNWWVVAVVIAMLFAAIVISIQPWGQPIPLCGIDGIQGTDQRPG